MSNYVVSGSRAGVGSVVVADTTTTNMVANLGALSGIPPSVVALTGVQGTTALGIVAPFRLVVINLAGLEAATAITTPQVELDQALIGLAATLTSGVLQVQASAGGSGFFRAFP